MGAGVGVAEAGVPVAVGVWATADRALDASISRIGIPTSGIMKHLDFISFPCRAQDAGPQESDDVDIASIPQPHRRPVLAASLALSIVLSEPVWIRRAVVHSAGLRLTPSFSAGSQPPCRGNLGMGVVFVIAWQ